MIKFFVTLSSFILSFTFFQLNAQTITSEGKTYELQVGSYALTDREVQSISRQISGQSEKIAQSSAIRMDANQGDSFIQKLAQYHIYQQNQNKQTQSIQNNAQNQINQLSESFKKEVVVNTQTNKIGVVNNILLKYDNLDDLKTLVDNNPNIHLLNVFKRIKLAVLAPKADSPLSTVDLYLDLQNDYQNLKLDGIERLSLDILENPKIPM